MPDFWDNPKEAERLVKATRIKKMWTDAYAQSETVVEDLAVLFEFYQAGEGTEEEVEAAYQDARNIVEALEFKNMLSAEEDQMNCIINIKSL